MKLEEVNLYDLDTWEQRVPHDMFALLRQQAPVFWQKEPQGGPGFWAVTKYADVVHVSKHPKLFSSWRGGTNIFDLPQEELGQVRMMLVNMDPPQHTKYRRLVSHGFTPRRIAELEPHVRDLARRIIDRVATKGQCDFVTEIAAELPLQVIAELLGIPQEDRHLVFDWSNRLIGFDDPEFQTSMEDGKRAAAEMWAYAHTLAEKRKRDPQNDLISRLLHAEVDGERLSELEFDFFFLLLAVAGNETTRNLISGGMLALFEHPEQKERLLAHPELMPTAVEEMLRWVSPVICFRRTATADTELRGQRIREGDKVVIFYISANRDEEVFDHADQFDIARSPNDHIAFGIGEHYCLGANLARMEIRVMFEEILSRLPDMELAGPPRRLRSNFISGIKSMPVRFTPERRRVAAGA